MQRGFETSEYQTRLAKAQSMMRKHDTSALLLTTEPDVRYFTGFLTRFWESPSRPWFLIVPQDGDPIAVIPTIGAALMGKTWITDIRTWSAPDLIDDGVSLLAETLIEVVGRGRVGLPMGHESHLRMPLADYDRVRQLCPDITFSEDQDILRALRMVKSEAEIAKIKVACDVAARAFDRVPEIARQGVALDQVFRDFQRLCLEEGADWVPYLAGGAGPFGYDDVISPAKAEPLKQGDVLMLDTGLVVDGYFCDFDRNFSVGAPKPQISKAYDTLLEAVEAGKAAARPGNLASDVFAAMDAIVTGGQGTGDAGRLGHGLGMQLTEWPSFIAGDTTPLQEGMVITLEPGVTVSDGCILVHEDNFVIRQDGIEQLSPIAPKKMVII